MLERNSLHVPSRGILCVLPLRGDGVPIQRLMLWVSNVGGGLFERGSFNVPSRGILYVFPLRGNRLVAVDAVGIRQRVEF